MSTITLKKPTGIRWLQLYQLYRTAFPRAERKPFRMIVSMARKGKTDIWCVERDGRFAGLAITINSPELVLLDYFAVSRIHRGEGIGTAALQAVLAHYPDRGLFLEIESTLEPSPNQQQRERRKRFYLAAGLEDLQAEAELFGVRMELMGIHCQLDFESYQTFYRENYSSWVAEHVKPVEK